MQIYRQYCAIQLVFLSIILAKSKGLFTRYQKEFYSGMSFVPDWSSYCIHMTKLTGSAILETTVLSVILKTIRMCHSPQATRFAFSSRNGVRFQFTWYQNEMSYQNENFIRFENRNDFCGNEISSRCHVSRYREIYGMEWTPPGMKVIPVPCEWPLKKTHKV